MVSLHSATLQYMPRYSGRREVDHVPSVLHGKQQQPSQSYLVLLEVTPLGYHVMHTPYASNCTPHCAGWFCECYTFFHKPTIHAQSNMVLLIPNNIPPALSAPSWQSNSTHPTTQHTPLSLHLVTVKLTYFHACIPARLVKLALSPLP